MKSLLKIRISSSLLIILFLGLVSCSSRPPMPVVKNVDLDRFMGKWYVIANLPTMVEKGAYDVNEVYKRGKGNRILTTYSFRKGGHDAKMESYNPTAYVTEDPSNAIWKMQFVWPFKADYRIVRLNSDYSQTVIAREKRDYFWIMAREPSIPGEDVIDHLEFLKSVGYDMSLTNIVPHAGTASAQFIN